MGFCGVRIIPATADKSLALLIPLIGNSYEVFANGKLIGSKGDMLKRIGTQARKELEEILGSKIFLGLFVKVAENWRENPMQVRELDWHTQLQALGDDESEQ